MDIIGINQKYLYEKRGEEIDDHRKVRYKMFVLVILTTASGTGQETFASQSVTVVSCQSHSYSSQLLLQTELFKNFIRHGNITKAQDSSPQRIICFLMETKR